jgi:hypothetical protein
MEIRPLNSHCKTLRGVHSILQNKSHVLRPHMAGGRGELPCAFYTPKCLAAGHYTCRMLGSTLSLHCIAGVMQTEVQCPLLLPPHWSHAKTTRWNLWAMTSTRLTSCPTSCLDLLNWRIPPTSYSLRPFSSCDLFFRGSPKYAKSHPIYFTHRFIFYKFSVWKRSLLRFHSMLKKEAFFIV